MPAGGRVFSVRKSNYRKLPMNLKQLITPKNEDGSIDHRYTPIAQSIADLAGERVEAQLRKLYSATSDLEKESASAGLQLVIAMFSIPFAAVNASVST